MSDIGKHLFEVSKSGFIWYRGRVTSETEKSWEATRDGDGARRVIKAESIIPAASMDVEARVEDARDAHEAECSRLEQLAREARREQQKAVIAALRGEPQ